MGKCYSGCRCPCEAGTSSRRTLLSVLTDFASLHACAQALASQISVGAEVRREKTRGKHKSVDIVYRCTAHPVISAANLLRAMVQVYRRASALPIIHEIVKSATAQHTSSMTSLSPLCSPRSSFSRLSNISSSISKQTFVIPGSYLPLLNSSLMNAC